MEELQQLEKRLRGAMFRRRLVLSTAALVALISTAAVLAMILSSIAALFVIPVPLKLFLLIVSIASVLLAVYLFGIKPIRSEKGVISAALRVEKNHPELKGRLVAALQFSKFDFSQTNFSPLLIEMTGRQASEMTRGIDFNEIVSGYPLYGKLKSALAVAVPAVLIGLVAPGIFTNAIDVYSQPTTLIAPPPGFSLTVVPGNSECVKYSDIAIGGELLGSGFPDRVEIFYRFSEGRWQSEEITIATGNGFTSTANDTVPFALTLRQVRRSLDYYIVAGDIRSETYALNVVERPRVANLKVSISYPAYTRLDPLTLDENNGSFAALIGSRVIFEIEANRDIDEAHIIVDDTLRRKIDFAGQSGRVTFTIEDDFDYYIKLLDRNGEENPDPIEYSVTAVPDEFPTVSVLYPGFDLNLDETMMIPFRVHIFDDFGFSSLALKYEIVSGGRKGGENVAIINYSDRIETEGEVSFNWDLDMFNLLPSDYILYHFELADNDRISGPKISSTRVYAARLPSIDEIVRQSESDQEGRVRESERMLREQKDMAQKLQQLAEQIRASEDLDWQNKKELENILEKQNQTAERLEEMAQEMEKSIEDMEKNNLLSEQLLQKLNELQKLFAEVATPEMKEAMKKLQEALENMDQDEIDEALKDFQLSQDEMLDRMERSIELLKRMQIQQKMAAMLKMAEEILLEQNRVNVDTEEAEADDDFSRLSRRETQLQKQLAVLKEEAGRLRELLVDSPYSDSEPHHRFSAVVEENRAADDMLPMEEELNQGEQTKALVHGDAASEKLDAMVNEMRRIIEETAKEEGKALADQMRNALDDANYLSQKQEDLLGKCQNGRSDQESMSQMAGEQQLLREAAAGLSQRINQLSQQSPFLAAEIKNYLNQSRQNMNSACNNLSNRRSRASQNDQRDAMYNLNRSAVRLLEGMQEQKQCNKGGSCNKPGQKMQSMSQQQKQINQQTQANCPKPGQNLSESQRQAMKRLAGEQGTVRKSIEDLQKEFGSRREVLGRLDALSDEVKKIEEMLEEGRAGQELQDRQLRIYSRMLDMQKSLTRRDFARERKAATADDILRASPGALENEDGRITETLQDRLNRYLQEGYPRQYEQQIKAYFKAISNLNQSTENRK
ncbi:MAG: hypothetical protein GY841_06465 [FCB group bacterium]|nr:hypothetical protein [FCB group bacterium]